MPLKLNEVFDCKITFYAFVKAIDHMFTTMQRRAGRKIKRQRAQTTFVGTFTGMDANVITQTLGSQKRLRTMFTVVTSNLQMRLYVLVKAVFQPEHTTAHMTSVLKVVGMRAEMPPVDRIVRILSRALVALVVPVTRQRTIFY